MKKNIRYRFRVLYIKFLLKIYPIIKVILPKTSKKLGDHIEKIVLINAKHINKIVSKIKST